MEEIINQLQRLFRRVLRQPKLELTREMSAKDVDGWDSLAHINLVIGMEREFKIQFKTTDIGNLRNIGEMADLVASKCHRGTPAQPRASISSLPTGLDIRLDPGDAGDEDLTVVKVYASAGGRVVAGDPLFDVENSKATREIAAPTDGILVHAITVGEILPSGAIVARILPIEQSDASVAAVISELEFAKSTLARSPRAAVPRSMETALPMVERVVGTRVPSVGVPIRPRKREEIRRLGAGAGNTQLSVIGVQLGPVEVSRSPGDFFAHKIVDLVAFESARLMRKYPRLNAYYDGGTVEIYSAVNVGIAFDEGERLVVYGIANADKKDLPTVRAEIERALVLYVEKKLTEADLSLSTFAITDLSSLNVDYLFPILPEGHSCIIGITRNVSRDFALHVGYDHRVTEGSVVAKFIGELRERVLSFAGDHATVPRCSFCDKPADEEVDSFRGRGLLKLLDARGCELLACQKCWSGW